MGGSGSFVDNLASGGGVLVGLDDKGYLSKWGIDKTYNMVFCSPTGVVFDGTQIPNYDSIKNFAISLQRKMPFADLIGWDIAVNKDGRPIVIECNLDCGEIEAHQVFNGPVFGNRTDEVMEFVRHRATSLSTRVFPF